MNVWRPLILVMCLWGSSCALFRPGVPPYPTGILFPLEESSSLALQGRTLSVLKGPENLVFVTHDDGRMSCLDAAEKKIRWTFAPGSPPASLPALSRESLFLIDERNILYGLDFEGTLLFKKPFSEKVTSLAAENEGRIYVGTAEGKLIVLDGPQIEKPVWEFQAGGPVYSTPIFHAGKTFVGSDDGRLYALDRTGRIVWFFEARGKIRIPACASDNRIVFGTEDSWLYCLNPLSGKKKWAFKLGGSPLFSPSIIGKRIVTVASNSTCYCLSAKNGEILWWKAVSSRILFEPVIVGDRILLSSASPEMTILELATGEVLGSDRLEKNLSAGALWLDPDVFAVVRDPGRAEERGIFLRKEVNLSVTASRPSPQPVGEAITFKADTVGFFRPKFVFAIIDNGERRIHRSENTEDSWIWFPEKPGSYRIHVRAVDEKQIRDAEITFVIEKRARQYSLERRIPDDTTGSSGAVESAP